METNLSLPLGGEADARGSNRVLPGLGEALREGVGREAGYRGAGGVSAPAIRIVVRGTPAPQGSKSFKGMTNAGRAILTESSKKVRPWRMDVKQSAEQWIAQRAAKNEPHAPINGPVIARMVFTLKKPASAPKTRRTYPMRTPDLSKLVRSTEDALTDAGIWADDARVIEYVRLAKVFPGEDLEALDCPGVVIEIMEVAQ